MKKVVITLNGRWQASFAVEAIYEMSSCFTFTVLTEDFLNSSSLQWLSVLKDKGQLGIKISYETEDRQVKILRSFHMDSFSSEGDWTTFVFKYIEN